MPNSGGGCSLTKAYYRFAQSIHKDAEAVLGLTVRFGVHYVTVALQHQGDKLPSFPNVVRSSVKAM